MARPKKLNPKKIAQQINEYIDTHDNPPFIATIVTDLNICSRSQLYELAKDCKELSDTLTRASEKCESMVLQRGLTGRYSSAISKLVLSNYGWNEKQEQEIDLGCTVSISGGDDYAQ